MVRWTACRRNPDRLRPGTRGRKLRPLAVLTAMSKRKMHVLTHRILLVAGTTLLGVAVIYGAPPTPVWPESWQVRTASAADFSSVVAPLRVAMKRKSAHRTDTIKPNGASCPGAVTAPLIPPASNQSSESTVQNSPAAPPPGGTIASSCPATKGDARADIARGHALATPEPLNSKQLIGPKAPG